jgi:2-dehydropantoate 2-reductase
MKCVMIGSGAVGSYFGARLQQAGHEVVFVARGEVLRVLQTDGLILQGDGEKIHLSPVIATDDLTSIGPVDYVLIAVKAWQVEDIAPKLPALQGPETRFLTLQNGVEAGPLVARYVGAANTLAGLVRGFFEMEAPGRVKHVGVQPTIVFGQVDGKRSQPAERLVQILIETGAHAEMPDDVDAALWEKFLLVTSLSGMGAVTRAPIGEIRDYAPTWNMLQAVMREIVQVALGHGVNLPDDVMERILQFVGTFPHEATTSMQRDVMNGLPSELEAQTGAVVRLGRAVSVPTPLNETIYNSLILQERRARAGK